jgi:hypothetical protein
MKKIAIGLILITVFLWPVAVMAQFADLAAVYPDQNDLNVDRYRNELFAEFSEALTEGTVNASTFTVHSRLLGKLPGSYGVDPIANAALFTATDEFYPGDVISATLTPWILSWNGIPINPFSWSFTIAATRGTGNFTGSTFDIATTGPKFIIAGDVDLDGDLDLVTCYSQGGVSIMDNNGSGVFTEDNNYTTGTTPSSIFLGDLDNDGYPDLAIANTGDNNVSVRLNLGDGSFDTESTFDVGFSPKSITGADLDGDGDIDLATANSDFSAYISILLNDGDGTFAAQNGYTGVQWPVSIVANDLNNDGFFDLATANEAQGNVSVFMNSGTGTFPSHSEYSVGLNPQGITAADIDRDGYLELITANAGSGSISVLPNNNNGTFGTHDEHTAGTQAFSVITGDFNSDGYLDVAAANWQGNDVSVFLSDNAGGLGTSEPYSVGGQPLSITAGDLNGDGSIDLATSNFWTDDFTILTNGILESEALVVKNTHFYDFRSLYWAVQEANHNPGLDTIVFAVSGTALAWGMWITDDSTVILGGTAPGGERSFVLDGQGIREIGFRISSRFNEIKDLVMYDYSTNCIQIETDSNSVTGCYLNVDAGGTDRIASGNGISVSGDYNVIGGCTAEERNVITGGASAYGIYVSGNENAIEGNYCGLKATGHDELANVVTPLTGIYVAGGTANIIGGAEDACGNVLSANYVGLELSLAAGTEILNNLVGVNSAGVVAIPNEIGIRLATLSTENFIGHDENDGNVISGNTVAGIILESNSDLNEIYGNRIGTNIAGEQSIGNGQVGIKIDDASNNIIGDVTPGFGNVISGNDTGVVLYVAQQNIIEGNYIGTNNVGENLGNTSDGIALTPVGTGGPTSENSIRNNVIANNGGSGIDIACSDCTGNTISQNLIYDNGELGIDLDNDGVTPNDVDDLDTGPNDLLNFPEITSAQMTSHENFEVIGIAVPDATVEFFVSRPAGSPTEQEDPSGHGEAFEYISSTICDGAGGFSEIIVRTYQHFFTKITITATDALGNTSEYCENFTLVPDLLVIWARAYRGGNEKQGTYSDAIVNLDVTDPALDYIRMDENGVLTQTIVEASYVENGEADIVTIDWPLEGDYDIKLIGTSADPSEYTVDLGISIDGTEQSIVAYDAVPPDFGNISDIVTYVVTEDFHYINGDADGNEIVDILDIVMLIDFKFKECPPGAGEGTCPAPDPYEAGDANCNGIVDIIDIVRLIDFKFKDSPGPCLRE